MFEVCEIQYSSTDFIIGLSFNAILCLYTTILFSRTTFNGHTSTFIMAMLLVLMISSAMGIATEIIMFMITKFCTAGQENKITRFGYAFFATLLVRDLTKNLVTWIFATKYWIVAYKVELFQNGINADSKQHMFAAIKYGGLTTCVILMILQMVLAATLPGTNSGGRLLGGVLCWVGF